MRARCAVAAARGRSSIRRSARPSPRAVASRRDAALRDHDQAVADLEQLVQLLADHEHGAARRRAAPAARRGSAPRRRRRRPRSAARRSAASASASISRPTMNFCRLPPERLLAAEPGPPALTLKRRISARPARRRRRADPAAGADRAGARQQRVLRQRQRRHGAAAQALFGHEVQPGARAASRGEARAMSRPKSAIDAGRRARVLARQRGHQLLLAVARDAGDADDLAGAHLEARCRSRSMPNGSSWRACSPRTASTHLARLARRGAAAAAARRRSSGARGWRWSPSCGSTSPVTLPPRSTVQ